MVLRKPWVARDGLAGHEEKPALIVAHGAQDRHGRVRKRQPCAQRILLDLTAASRVKGFRLHNRR